MQPRRRSGEPRRLRKCARDDQIFVAANPGDHGDARKFEVGFVDHDHRARARPSEFAASLASDSRLPVGLFGLGRKNTRGPASQRREHFVPRETHRGVVSRRDDARSRQLRIEPVHRVGWLDEQNAVARFDERVDDEAERFVCAVGEQKFLGLDAEMLRQLCGAPFPARDRPKSDAALSFASARRTAGEQPMGFSLKSRRSFSVRPSSGG